MSGQAESKSQQKIWDFMTLVVLAIVLAVVILTIIIFQFPAHSINPFPPPTMPALMLLPSATVTSSMAPASPTGIINPTKPDPTATLTIRPSATSTNFPLSTQTNIPPSSGYRYQIQGSPVAISASIFDPSRTSCNWMGVAGQIHDIQDRPVTGILVLLGGQLGDKKLDQIMMSGTALNYGPAGFEFQLSDAPLASTAKVWIQLVDQSYIPLSAKVYFDTFADESCDRNLIIINFIQVR